MILIAPSLNEPVTTTPEELLYGDTYAMTYFEFPVFAATLDTSKCPIDFVFEMVQGPSVDLCNFIQIEAPRTTSTFTQIDVFPNYRYEFQSEDYAFFGT